MAIYKSTSTIGFGAIVVTIDSVAYILESWSPVAPVEIVERKNELNEPNGFVQIVQARTASATAQLATATTPLPTAGDEFTVDSVVYVVGEVTAPKEQSGIWKCTFNAREKI